MDALARSVLCFALIHEAVLLVYVLRSGDTDALNVFTMLAGERLFPDLGRGGRMLLLSLIFAAGVYALVFALMTGRSAAGPTAAGDRTGLNGRAVRGAAARARAAVPSWNGDGPGRGDGSPGDARNGVVARSAGRRARWAGALRPTAGAFRVRPTPWTAALVATAGLVLHMGCLQLIERFVPSFPSVPDVLLERLPYVDFGLPGELFFLAFLALVTIVIVRARAVTVSAVVTQLGLFYAVRALFLFFHPIGSPADAPPIAGRFVLYPFPSHAYFPGGHVGLMTILSLSVHQPGWRRAFLAGTFLFALGTMLARTHYTADALGGLLVGYAIVSWGRRHLETWVTVGAKGATAPPDIPTLAASSILTWRLKEGDQPVMPANEDLEATARIGTSLPPGQTGP